MTNLQYADEQAASDARSGAPNEAEMQAWIVARLARELEIDPKGIDVRASFNRYGLDSVSAVHLVSDLETWLGLELSPTLPYEYPSVEALAAHLVTLRGTE